MIKSFRSKLMMVEYPDPDFNNFDRIRNDDCFFVGQIWAVYDTLDAMPRFYAQISRVFSPEFKLRITWMEPEKESLEGVSEDLLAACGEFRHGKSENIVDRLMFSHKIQWEKGYRRNTYWIFPRIGEIWAIFKNWDIKWRSDVDPNWKFEYEFVEVLSEYEGHSGASVAYLGKVKGFVSVFCRTSKEGRQTFRIPPGELFRFSHMIPSFKLTGEERLGVPKGSFELDPASLPLNIEEISVHKHTSVELLGYTAPDFNDFDQIRNHGAFSVAQVWAVYDTWDAMPRFYAVIRKVFSPEFKLRITWLEPNPSNEDENAWVNEDLPTSCGEFRYGKSEYTVDRLMFSHKMHWEEVSQWGTYMIFPRKGEIWAIFKNWDIKWKSDVDPNRKFEYEFVEILSEYSGGVSVSVAYLGKVKGFATAFCRISKGGKATFQISLGELFRFSHMIPSFKLTGEERQGVPKGSFELDPASLPKNIEEIPVPECTLVDYPNPDFNDFNKIRNNGGFSIGQIWAVYDTFDNMPRFYAQIRKVFSSDFKLIITWMEPNPSDEYAVEWLTKDLPISCGEFRCGDSEDTVNHLMFSHKILWTKGSQRDTYMIFPRKGEIWAIFKNWDIKGVSDIDPDRMFQYEFVEILSEYSSVGASVAYLGKVKGFVSVFCLISKGGIATFQIPPGELFQFSHMIPSFKLSGEERRGVPMGSFELDPASLPRNIEEISVSEDTVVGIGTIHAMKIENW